MADHSAPEQAKPVGFIFIPDDPRIGATDVDTWRAVPGPNNLAGSRIGSWYILAGEYADEPDVVIEISAEFPEDVAKFIVTAVRNEIDRRRLRDGRTWDEMPSTSRRERE